MFGSQALETALGLAFFFLAISIMVTGVQEFIATALKLRANTLASGIKQLMAQGQELNAAAQAILQHPGVNHAQKSSYVPSDAFAMAVVDVLSDGKPTAPFSEIVAAIDKLPDSPLKTAAQSVASRAAGDVTAFEQALAKWFDDNMDRVSGQYKRLCGYFSLSIGLMLSLLFNLDAIAVCKTLWLSPELREQVAAAATVQAANGKAVTNILTTDQALAMFDFQVNNFSTAFSGIAFVGCLITAFAISMGAPFWFDFLQNVLKLNVRGTGDKPARSNG